MTSPDSSRLVTEFAAAHPEAFAREIARGATADLVDLLALLPVERRIEILARLPAGRIGEIIDAVPDFGKLWLSPAPADSVRGLLNRLPREQRLALAAAIEDREKRVRIQRQQQYPSHTIGNLVVDIPIRVVETAGTGDLLKAIRSLGERDPGLLVVISKQGQYRGVLDPWALLATSRPVELDHYVRSVKPLLAEMASVDVADDERWNEFAWLPVVDHEGHVLGRVSRARVIRSAREQALQSLQQRDFVIGLFDELVYLLGGILERLLAGPTPR